MSHECAASCSTSNAAIVGTFYFPIHETLTNDHDWMFVYYPLLQQGQSWRHLQIFQY